MEIDPIVDEELDAAAIANMIRRPGTIKFTQ